MGRKHLIYVYYEQFESEKNKTALVNELLAKHYGMQYQPVRVGRKPKKVEDER